MKNFLLFIIFLFTAVSISFVNPASLIGQGVDSNHAITLFDLTYSLDIDPEDSESVEQTWDHAHTIATLQGIVNRKAPRLYLFFVENEGINIDRYWWNIYRAPGKWLSGEETRSANNIIELISLHRTDINGIVLYDSEVPATSNVASAIAGIENLIAVRYDPDPGSLCSQLMNSFPDLPIKVSLIKPDGSSLFTGTGSIPGTDTYSSGSAKNDAYLWFIEHYMNSGKANAEYGAYYIDQAWRKNPAATRLNHHTLTNHDFFVSRKAFFFDLSPWGDETATDDPHQNSGTDLETLKKLLLTAYEHHNGRKMTYIGGFPPWAFKYTTHAGGDHEPVPTEWEYSKIISAYNAFKDADAIGYGALANASFWQHFPLKEIYSQKWITRDELLHRDLLNRDGTVNFSGRDFVIFYVGDYDASSWVSQTTPTLWDNPDRGKIPMMWCLSPVLEERVPHALHYRRETATSNDYFAAADNGAGYLNPGMLQAPRPISNLPSGLDAWVKHCSPYYERWDLSITGFIIDGYAPGLNAHGLDAYAQFSSNGIVPQKIPLTLLYENMPVLRAGDDINDLDPVKAAERILEAIPSRPIPFHWFRNILKSPSWYTQVVAEMEKRNPNVVLLDAPAFFELYRIYLHNNPAAARGDIGMK